MVPKTLKLLLSIFLVSAATVAADPVTTHQVVVDATGNPTTTLNLGGAHVTGTLAPQRLGSYALPAGAMGVWYADQYVAADHPYIPNAAAPLAPVSANLFAASRRMFANGQFWSGSGLTDANLPAPDGTASASILNATGGWYMGPHAGDILPVGTYTEAAWVRRNTGSDQVFAFSPDNTATRSTVQTATSTWQRFSYTFTTTYARGINQILMCSSDGSTAANLQICDVELYAGSADLGPQTYAGHLYLGSSAFDTKPTVSGSALDLSTGGYGLIQLPQPRTFSGGLTAVCVASKVAAGSSYQAFLSHAQSYGQFSAYLELGGHAAPVIGDRFGEQPGIGLWTFFNRGYFCFAQRITAAATDAFIDGGHLLTRASGATVNLSDLFVGIVSDASLNCGYKIHAIALYPRALSDGEVSAASYALMAHATQSAITLTTPRFYVAMGDSITGGFAYAWPYQFGPLANPPVIGANLGISGSTVDSVRSVQLPQLAAFVASKPAGSKIIVSLALGANDLQGSNPGFVAGYAALADDIRALGVKLAVATVLPCGTGQVNAQRATANPIIGSWNGVHADAIIPFGTDATMGPDTAASNSSLYGDTEHPTSTGAGNLAAIAAPVLNGL